MSLWIRLCNHTYIHTYIQKTGNTYNQPNLPSTDTHHRPSTKLSMCNAQETT